METPDTIELRKKKIENEMDEYVSSESINCSRYFNYHRPDPSHFTHFLFSPPESLVLA